MVVMEMLTFEDDLLPPPRCESPLGRRVERALRRAIANHELIDDDKVVSAEFEVPLKIEIRKFDLDEVREYARDATGHLLGFRERHAIRDLEEDFPKLRHSTCRFDREATESCKAFALDVLGDLMPVVEKNKSLEWHFGVSQRIIELMGMEGLMIAMADCPEAVLALYDFVADDMIQLLRWQEENGLMRANNRNDYAGAGSYGFTRELCPEESIVSRMLWGNMNSQETVSISPGCTTSWCFRPTSAWRGNSGSCTTAAASRCIPYGATSPGFTGFARSPYRPGATRPSWARRCAAGT